MDAKTKECLNCGAPVVGRIDKKFCDDQCRSAFYNHQNREVSKLIRKVNVQLKHNRTILHDLLENAPEGQTKVSHRHLVDKKFDFQYITHIYESKKGARYFFCYEYGYLPFENGWYLIVKKFDN